MWACSTVTHTLRATSQYSFTTLKGWTAVLACGCTSDNGTQTHAERRHKICNPANHFGTLPQQHAILNHIRSYCIIPLEKLNSLCIFPLVKKPRSPPCLALLQSLSVLANSSRVTSPESILFLYPKQNQKRRITFGCYAVDLQGHSVSSHAKTLKVNNESLKNAEKI